MWDIEKRFGREKAAALLRHRAFGSGIGRASRYFGVLFLLVCILGFGCSPKKGESGKKPSGVGVEKGLLAPDFKIRNLKGGLTSLSEYRGKVVLVNFWATWCGPCKAEMPSMEALYRSYKREDFEILAVSIDTEEPPVRAFVADFGFTFPILLDFAYTLSDQYQVRVAPTSFLIDRRGVVAHWAPGARDWNDSGTRAMLDRLIASKS